MALKVKLIQKRPAPLSAEALSVRFAQDGENYAAAAMVLDEFKFHRVRYHLFCHAFELILKSFILSAGAKESDVFRIGHRLNVAFTEAVKRGYKPGHPTFDTLVDWLHLFHVGHDFRYARGGYQLLPTEDDLLAAFTIAHAEIAPLARAAYLKKHPPT